ncbi:MAG: acetyl-CoA carboxylase biotin carboxyl carrier protein [Deltaproteobacteria bacterium]
MAGSKKPSRRAASSSPAKKPTPVNPNIARLEKLVRILERSSLTELEYEDKDIVVRLARGGVVASAPAPVITAAPVAAPAPEVAAPSTAEAPANDSGMHVIKSPFVGTFYRSPSPEDPAFCEVGSEVTKGQTLCIVEAMKLMNEIECDVAGTVQEILIDNGKAVQFGEPLFKIQKK